MASHREKGEVKMVDVCDGEYIGYMTPEQTIEQHEYRAGIHLSYLTLMEENPGVGWEVYGSKKWHHWAINGYQQGINHLRRGNFLARMMRWGFRLVYK